MLIGWLVASGAPGRVRDWGWTHIAMAAAGSGFTVRDIMVEGRVNTDPKLLRDLIGMERGDPILLFDPAEARSAIERVSWVREARVERRLPDTIYVQITERQPLALWQDKKKLRLIDGDGTLLTDKDLDRFARLLIVVGRDAPREAPALVAMLQSEPGLRKRIEAATLVGGRRWDLRLKNHLTVSLPEENMALAIERLAKAQRDEGILDKDLSAIDLRDADRIIVQTRARDGDMEKSSTPAKNI